MQKKLAVLLLFLLCAALFAGCGKSMRYIIAHKPCITGTVQKVQEDYAIVYCAAAEGYPNGSCWQISLHPENPDSYTDLCVGDEVAVYYGGGVMETDPLRVGRVYAITLVAPAGRNENSKP